MTRLAALSDSGRWRGRSSWPQTGLILLLALALGIRLVPAWLLQHEVADILTYRAMGEIVLRGDNIYAPRVLFPYTPFSQFLPAWLLQLAEATGWRFDFVAKLPAILADVGSALLIYVTLRWEGVPSGRTLAWTAAWALNPVGILISAFHGNIMSVIPFLTLSAYVAALRADQRADDRGVLLAIAALLLGVAIAMRSFPVLLLPPFLLLFCRNTREMVIFAALAMFAPVASSVPYLLYARESFLREVLGYSGFEDFGWVAVLRALRFFIDGQKVGMFAPHLVEITKRLFLGAYALSLLLLPFFRREALGRALLIAPLLFYALYGAVSAQYLVWVVPLAIAVRERMVIPFSVVSAAALVAFYAGYHPGILVGRYPIPMPEPRPVMGAYVAGNIGLVVVSLAWVGLIIAREVRAYVRARPETSVGWVSRLAALRTSQVYRGLLVLLSLAWLYAASEAGRLAQGIVQSMLR